MNGAEILPGTGRGTARSAVEGGLHLLSGCDCFDRPRRWGTPSTSLRLVPLPVPGRI